MVFNATFNNISVSVYRGGFISGGNWSTYLLYEIKTHLDKNVLLNFTFPLLAI
jgi:hypothetical protein